jgi:hypothetical protein
VTEARPAIIAKAKAKHLMARTLIVVYPQHFRRDGERKKTLSSAYQNQRIANRQRGSTATYRRCLRCERAAYAE